MNNVGRQVFDFYPTTVWFRFKLPDGSAARGLGLRVRRPALTTVSHDTSWFMSFFLFVKCFLFVFFFFHVLNKYINLGKMQYKLNHLTLSFDLTDFLDRMPASLVTYRTCILHLSRNPWTYSSPSLRSNWNLFFSISVSLRLIQSNVFTIIVWINKPKSSCDLRLSERCLQVQEECRFSQRHTTSQFYFSNCPKPQFPPAKNTGRSI